MAIPKRLLRNIEEGQRWEWGREEHKNTGKIELIIGIGLKII
jgi:hypothetical protein